MVRQGNSTIGQVYLVGAGPGNVELLTLRAVECLRRADFVLYDRLVSERALQYAEHAESLCVNQLPGSHPERVPHIHQQMIDAAKQGKCVVRLKGGDPSIFGRVAEEAAALREAGIEYEIVPGITACLGAAAYAGFSLTHRRHSSAVAFVTGHEDPNKANSSLDWHALAHFPGTLVFYMGIERLESITSELISQGRDTNEPAALIHQATRGEQKILQATLGTLTEAQNKAKFKAPSLVVIGTVLEERPEQSWFEALPLLGKRVLITRPAHQTNDFLRELESLGAIAYSQPTVEVVENGDWSEVDEALNEISTYQWLVFTSVNGVDAFMNRLRHLGKDMRALGQCQLATIGPATANALRRYYLEPDLIPESYISESLVEALKDKVQGKGKRVLLARADRGREILRDELSSVADVKQIPVYVQRDVTEADKAIVEMIRQGEMDYITLTSSNIARSLAKLLDEACHQRIRAGEIQLVTISPQTSQACQELDWPVTVEASEYNIPGIIDALLDHVRKGVIEQ